MISITDIMNFYLEKETHYPGSDEFIKKYRQPNQGYIKLASDMNKNMEAIQNDENRKIIYSIFTRSNELKTLKLVKQVMDYQPLDLSSDVEPNQKWHLLISYIVGKEALTDYETIKNLVESGKMWNNFQCPELCLWIAEASGFEVDDIVKRAKEMCALGQRRKVCGMIRNEYNISWDRIVCAIKNSKIDNN